MFAFFAAVLSGWTMVCGVLASEPSSAEQIDRELTRPSITVLRQQTRAMLREHAAVDKPDPAKRDDGAGKDMAAVAKRDRYRRETERMVDWFAILRSDPRWRSSELLRGAAGSVAVRLRSAAKTIERSLADEDRPTRHDRDAWAAEIARHRQRMLPTSSAAVHPPTAAQDFASSIGAAGGGNRAGEAAQLIALIETVIRPDFWESRGGPGTIVYFAARRVLVVSATSDVHQRLKDLLMALR